MFGFIRNSAMDASNSLRRSRINATDSVTSGHSFLRKLCCDICSRTVKRFDRITKNVNFAVNLQILSLVKFNFPQGQKAVEDCNTELTSALSNGCIRFDEAMLGYHRQQKEHSVNLSPDKIFMTRPELNLKSSRLCKSELVGIICSSLNRAVRRIAFLDHWQGFIEPRISYSDFLRMSCRNLITVFNHSQDHMISCCSHQSDNHILSAELGNICHNMCAVTSSGEALSISTNPCTFSFGLAHDCSERNIGGLIENDTTTIQTGLANVGMKVDEKCTKTESLETKSNCADSLCYSFHSAAADKSGNVAVSQNSKDLDKNFSDFVCSPLSINDATIAITDNCGQLVDFASRPQSTKTCDKKASRRRHRHMQLHSAQQCFGWRGLKFCRKRNRRQLKSRGKLQQKCRPQVQVAGNCHSTVTLGNTFHDVEYFVEADISQREDNLDRSLKLSLSFNDPIEDLNYAEGGQTCLQVRCDETDDDDDNLANDGYCSVTDEEADDEVTDEETTSEEETDEDEETDDELNSESIQDEDISEDETDEETDEKELNGKAAAFAGSRSNKTDTNSAIVRTVCKSSFFISPSEMDSSDSSTDSDDAGDEDDDLEVDAWDSSEHQNLDALSNGICDSFSFNGLYFPSSCSPVEARLSLEELKENYRTQMSSASDTPHALTVDCSGIDNSYDDIVFCDDHELHSVGNEDDEDLPFPNFSHLQSINAKWNHFYSTPMEVEKPMKKKKQVCFARDSSLVTTYAEAVSEAEDYAAARKGPWEEYARDRGRFTRRMRDTAEQISWVLSPGHRSKVYQRLFSECS